MESVLCWLLKLSFYHYFKLDFIFLYFQTWRSCRIFYFSPHPFSSVFSLGYNHQGQEEHIILYSRNFYLSFFLVFLFLVSSSHWRISFSFIQISYFRFEFFLICSLLALSCEISCFQQISKKLSWKIEIFEAF